MYMKLENNNIVLKLSRSPSLVLTAIRRISDALYMYFLSSNRDHVHRNNLEMTNLSFDLQTASPQSMFATFFCCITVEPL